MNFAVTLTIEDLTRSLRSMAHDLADSVEQQHRIGKEAGLKSEPELLAQPEKGDMFDDFASR
ncbi:hypothetical protein GA830_11030 [Mesorhizobium sp. NBSH29]|uniref:hypothetical protein n=1 Tax=Mesorhizobium sp. NBSH29 TaxID=2654249 RepID=UPI0018965B04|nr:hypothetical protein [Mesorhizobium sp. NBSH29]QPC87214.1 hypothetical protein GA830_11030 [Mesorhizobium sp. NBSH29]